MKPRITPALGAMLALLVATPVVAQRDDDEASVREAVDGFKTALRGGEGATALAYLDDGVRIFEGGHGETKEQYASGHLAGDMAFLAAVESTTTWSRVEVDGDVAVHLSEYEMRGTYRDREIEAHGTETMVLVRTDDGWRIRHIHWSSR